ncbi:hypothetical protein FCM35_KLT05447 [Carex littledalei]|uniref:Uncharacterized protein n=1 Tax=Carex littledalei TaxID=544730 RepID=A0A833V9S7_9POAL|nr:hypothetical protein FCM35_KLT05447 [Carex littledalei]
MELFIPRLGENCSNPTINFHLNPHTRTMGCPGCVIIAMLIAFVIGSAHFSEAYVEKRHLDVWNMDSEFQMDSNVHQMLLQASNSEVGYDAMRNANKPASPNGNPEPGKPYTGHGCLKIYHCG